MCVGSGPRREWDECLIEPLLYQSKNKVNIDLSGLEKEEWMIASADVEELPAVWTQIMRTLINKGEGNDGAALRH